MPIMMSIQPVYDSDDSDDDTISNISDSSLDLYNDETNFVVFDSLGDDRNGNSIEGYESASCSTLLEAYKYFVQHLDTMHSIVFYHHTMNSNVYMYSWTATLGKVSTNQMTPNEIDLIWTTRICSINQEHGITLIHKSYANNSAFQEYAKFFPFR